VHRLFDVSIEAHGELMLDPVLERANLIRDQVLLKQLVTNLLALRPTGVKGLDAAILNVELNAGQMHQLRWLEHQRFSLRD